MQKYDDKEFDPPAPIAYATLRNLATGDALNNVPLLIDTGADVTALPLAYVQELGIEPNLSKAYEAIGFDGAPRIVYTAELEIEFLNYKFKGQFLLVEQPIGYLGRNILNNLRLLFDGPRGEWGEQKK